MIMMIGCDRIKHACTSQFLGFSQNDVTNVHGGNTINASPTREFLASSRKTCNHHVTWPDSSKMAKKNFIQHSLIIDILTVNLKLYYIKCPAEIMEVYSY